MSEDEDDDPNLPKPAVEPDIASHLVTEPEPDCRNCTFHMEPPIQMEDSDQSGEVLIYPKNEVNDEEWLQKYVIEQDRHRDEKDSILCQKRCCET